MTLHPANGETIHLEELALTVYHAPGHTPDHIVLVGNGALFSSDALLIRSVARTDFLDGEPSVLLDSIQRLLWLLPGATLLFPGHDYHNQIQSSLGAENENTPWLRITDRCEFERRLSANPPPRPANMDIILSLNRETRHLPRQTQASELVERVMRGAATSVLDVRTAVEHRAECIDGSVHIPLDQLDEQIERILAMPAPRLLLCRTGSRARLPLESLNAHGVASLSVVVGGVEAYRSAGGSTHESGRLMSLERQVHIAAGSLIALAIALGYLLHPGLFAVAGLLGGGLVFAGLTDRCSMGPRLAKMPWNRGVPPVATEDSSPASAPGSCAATLPDQVAI